MSRSKKKPNTLNRTAIQQLQEQIVTAWPWTSVAKGFYIENPTPLGVSESTAFKDVVVGAAVELRGDQAHVRIYRKPDAGDKHNYDVDEIRGATGPLVTVSSKPDIDDHHLTGTIPDDLMRRNNLTVEVVPDGEGGMKLNVQPDGLVKAFINFEDPPRPIKGK